MYYIMSMKSESSQLYVLYINHNSHKSIKLELTKKIVIFVIDALIEEG